MTNKDTIIVVPPSTVYAIGGGGGIIAVDPATLPDVQKPILATTTITTQDATVQAFTIEQLEQRLVELEAQRVAVQATIDGAVAALGLKLS
jgi:hypothetical protein